MGRNRRAARRPRVSGQRPTFQHAQEQWAVISVGDVRQNRYMAGSGTDEPNERGGGDQSADPGAHAYRPPDAMKDGNDAPGPVGRGVTTGQAARIAWYRARASSLVRRAWGGAWGLDVIVATWLWPMHLAIVAGQGDQIRHWKTASMAVSDGNQHRTHRPSFTLGVVALIAQLVLLIIAGAMAAVLLMPLLNPSLASSVAVLVIASPLLLECGVGAVLRLTRDRESLTLNRRHRELGTQGPSLVMSSFVRASHSEAKGHGAILLAAMTAEWRDQRAIVIFYPANGALTEYYRRAGAGVDIGALRRMSFDFRMPVTAGNGAGTGQNGFR